MIIWLVIRNSLQYLLCSCIFIVYYRPTIPTVAQRKNISHMLTIIMRSKQKNSSVEGTKLFILQQINNNIIIMWIRLTQRLALFIFVFILSAPTFYILWKEQEKQKCIRMEKCVHCTSTYIAVTFRTFPIWLYILLLLHESIICIYKEFAYLIHE